MLKALLAASLAFLVSAPALGQTPAYTVKGPIEAKYQSQGPWAVSKTVSSVKCDRENRLCDIWYPTNLGSNPISGVQTGFKHPVISWANGSGQVPAVYEFFLRHLASWGFVVVASRDDGTGNGDTTVDAANYILNESAKSSSVFYGKLDRSNMGAIGHSQGGASISNLHARKNPLFKTYIGYHTSPFFFSLLCCNVIPSTYNGSGVTASVFQWSSTPDSGTPDWYNPVPSTALKAYAQLKYTKHGDIGQGASPTCSNSGCAQGPAGYLGYSTAWLMWQLQGAADGGAAFKQNGEFFIPNDNWSTNLSNVP